MNKNGKRDIGTRSHRGCSCVEAPQAAAQSLEARAIAAAVGAALWANKEQDTRTPPHVRCRWVVDAKVVVASKGWCRAGTIQFRNGRGSSGSAGSSGKWEDKSLNLGPLLPGHAVSLQGFLVDSREGTYHRRTSSPLYIARG